MSLYIHQTAALTKPPRKKPTMNTAEAYEKVTARILSQLAAGTVPWVKPWTSAAGAPALGAWPVNVSGRGYRGINLLILMSAGYASPVWLTYNQARKLGGNVKRGKKGTTVLLWKKGRTYTETSESGEESERRGFYATTFTVFNVEQCEGLPESVLPAAAAPVASSELVADYLSDGGPKLTHGGNVACYQPGTTSPPCSTSWCTARGTTAGWRGLSPAPALGPTQAASAAQKAVDHILNEELGAAVASESEAA